MIDEKRLREAENRVKQYLREGIIQTKNEPRFVDFFVGNASKSLRSAHALFELSTNTKMQEVTGYPKFDGFLWVVNTSYYSMFYIARALLEKNGIKIRSDLSVHLITFDALVNFFYLNGKLQKKLMEDFIEAKEDASDLLGKQKADQLIEEYYWEKDKRARFTYLTREAAIKSKAQTSLERATGFFEKINNLLH